MFDLAGCVANYSLANFTTLKAGGAAEFLYVARNRDDLVLASRTCARTGKHITILGSGSNVLPSDHGISGLVMINASRDIAIQESGLVEVSSGTAFQDLFLATAQASLGGFEFAVGIPGTVGGALVSNAGAYRNSVSAFLVEVEVYRDGVREWTSPEFLNLSYRDSILRQIDPPRIALLAMRFKLEKRDSKAIFADAREYQRQRIGKQPPSASAGSFFKNVVDSELAKSIAGLTPGMREAGVVPAGFLIEQCGLKGKRFGGAMIGSKHANFLLNVGGASASELRRLAEHAARCVHEKFGVKLEEEALYIGDWTGWEFTGDLSN